MLKQLIWYHSTEKKKSKQKLTKNTNFCALFSRVYFRATNHMIAPVVTWLFTFAASLSAFFFLRCCTRCQRKPIQTKNAGNFSCCCSNHIGALIYVVCSFLFWTFGFFTLLSFYAALSRWQSAFVASLFGGMAGWLVSVVGGDRCAP